MRWSCLAIMVAMVASTASAAPQFAFSALNGSWSEGEARPAALEYRGAGLADGFHVTASSATLEVDQSRQATFGEVSLATTYPDTSRNVHGASVWDARPTSTTPSLFLVADDAHVTMTAGLGWVQLPAEPCIRQPEYFTHPREAVCVPSGDAFHIASSSTSWTVQGNFTVILWGWGGSVQDGSAHSTFWTGSRPTQNSVAGQGELDLRQAYLTVTNGTMALHVSAAASLYATSATLAVDAPVSITNKAGQAVQVKAGTRLHLARDHDSLAASAVATQAASGGGIATWVLGALGAAVLAPVALVIVLRRQDRLHIELANHNLAINNPAAAARHAARVNLGWRNRLEAATIGVIACISSGNLATAEVFLKRLHAVDRHEEAACKFLGAGLRIRQGRLQDGQAMLEECIRLDPSYRVDAAHDPVLAPFLDPSQWPRGS